MKILKFAVGSAILLSTFPVSAGEKLALRITPTMASEPADMRITATIEPNSDNRVIEVVADSDEYYRSSEITLEGENAPRTNIFQFRSLPAGSYEVRATLISASGKLLAVARRHAEVVGGLAR
jgi:hypothetical protein